MAESPLSTGVCWLNWIQVTRGSNELNPMSCLAEGVG